MFKRRDIPPVLLLLLLIILVMLTLSQILVVHNGRYGRNVHNMRKLQIELRQMDVNLHSLMMQNVPSIELNRRLLQNEINTARFAQILEEASKIDPKAAAATKRRRRQQLRMAANNTTSIGTETRRGVKTDSVTAASDVKLKNPVVVVEGRYSGQEAAHHSAAGSSGLQPPRNISGSFNKSSERTSLGNGWADGRYSSSSSGSTAADDIPSPRQGRRTGSQTEEVSQAISAAGSKELLNQPSKARTVSPSSSQSAKKVLKYCPSVPPTLKGSVFINLGHRHNFSLDEIIKQNPDVRPGGEWRPARCTARHKVAIIIPYRDRLVHLVTLLAHLHPVLQRQQLDYRVFVVEQFGKDTFNKARIMNIAFVEALKQYHFQCFVFHDVDLVPEDDRNMYSCPTQPRHMSVAIDEMGYKLAYQELVGGVLNMRTEHFQRVNGYSNLYWGWGAEDDDMAYRIMHVGLKITRPPDNVARYKMARHTKRKPSDWRKRLKLLYTGTRRFQFDGLNTLQYKLVHIKKEPLYTHILVNIGKPPKGF